MNDRVRALSEALEREMAAAQAAESASALRNTTTTTKGTTMTTANGETKEATTQQPATAMVAVKDEFSRELQPRTQNELFGYCNGFAKIHFAGVKTPEEAMGRIIAGRELGLSMVQSLKGCFLTPEGKPGFEAALLHAVCLERRDVCEEFRCIHADEQKATYRAKRRGREARDYTFTISMAERAGLLGKDNWKRYPVMMLEARAKAWAANGEFPDITRGFKSSEEMLDVDVIDVPAEPVQPEIATPARDIPREVEALKVEIREAKTPEQRKVVRAKIAAFERDVGGAPYEDVKAYYNEALAAAKKTQQAPTDPAPEGSSS